ncbi:MAG: cation:proton antiporter [Actinomycetota bacterium]|nr:cation:proton antiporter [Actinomycetota bacterium]
MGLLVFALVLLVAVLVSELAHRSVLSTAVVFLVAGFVAGTGVTDLIDVTPDAPAVRQLAEVALFAVLFTDGMRVGIRDLASAWRLPGRALFFGMPLTLVVTALLAHLIAGLGWLESFLIGAVLSPTDPVFAAAIVGRTGVPKRLRHLLNVESGLNDGLALPVVIVLLALLDREPVDAIELVLELVYGIVVGIAVPWIALRLEKTRYLSPEPGLAALLPVAIGLAVFAISSITHANLFLAAFFAGMTVETVNPAFTKAFQQFGHLISEILKLAAILVFAALISPAFLAEISVAGYVFAVLTLLLARPVSIGIALLGARIRPKEWAAAAWFGPKGFASVVYGLLVARSGVTTADEMFHLIAIVVAGSILLHSSTDVVVARQFSDLEDVAPLES